MGFNLVRHLVPEFLMGFRTDVRCFALLGPDPFFSGTNPFPKFLRRPQNFRRLLSITGFEAFCPLSSPRAMKVPVPPVSL